MTDLAAPPAAETPPPTGPPPLLELDNVTKSYAGQPGLGPVSLTIPQGAVGLLGPNGAGKSTLIRLMLGILRPTSGTVRVLGEPAGSPAARRRLGYAPEGDATFPGLTGIESVAYAGRLSGMGRDDALQRAHQVLDYVDLGEARYRQAAGYSTGMRQRLKLAQALVHGPDVLVLDEPTEGVDPESRRHILQLLGELAREHGLSVLLSTHLLHDVEALASHAVVLHQGQVAAQGPLGLLKAAPKPGLVVRVQGDAATLARHLEAKGIGVEAHAPALRVAMADPARLLREAKEAGVVVRQVTPLELSLNEAFEQVVGGAPVA